MDMQGGQTLAGSPEADHRPQRSLWRVAAWSAIPILLLVPLIAMQFTDEVDWDVFDFTFMGGMMVGVGIALELAARKSGSASYRIGMGLALAAGFLTLWVNGAVGIIGNEDDPANIMFFLVLGVGFVGAMIARFEPRGMARAMTATAVAQVSAFAIALVAGWGFAGPITLFFLAFWLGSAQQFRQAAREAAAVT